MFLKKLTFILILTVLFSSCQEVSLEQETESDSISIEKLKNSPSYKSAKLQLITPSNNNTSLLTDTVDFVFNLENYTLKKQTESSLATSMANSKKGQHIHFILNNQPYSAHYTPTFTKKLPKGVHHLVAFLSRSYHESIKNGQAMVVKKLHVGDNTIDSLQLDMSAPCLIYSRPKGTYVGKDTENLLLDFFVLNTRLSANGNKVKAKINEQTFLLTEWAPYIIKGLPMGKVTVELELIDSKGNAIDGPFNKVKRIVTLQES
jgi:hypothetical protein